MAGHKYQIPKKMFNYFIAYFYTTENNKWGFDNTEVLTEWNMDCRVKGRQAINEMEAELAKNGKVKKVSIINWKERK